MKSTIVPAQITTVEDRVAGNLSLSQMLLLIAPVFIGSGIYIILPPVLDLPAYKIVIIAILAAAFSMFAIRIKGKILLLWAVIIMRYAARPRYWVYDKNELYLRDIVPKSAAYKTTDAKEAPKSKQKVTKHMPNLSITDAARLRYIIDDPKAKLHFKTDKKGALRVYVTEVK